MNVLNSEKGKKSDYQHVKKTLGHCIGDPYFTIRSWTQGFISSEATIDSVAAWVRLPKMRLSFYASSAFQGIGDSIGRRAQKNRKKAASRGKVARLCVELDLTKTILQKFGSLRGYLHIYNK